MTSSSSQLGARMEMEIYREGPTTPKKITGYKRLIETLQRPRTNRVCRQLVLEIPLLSKRILL